MDDQPVVLPELLPQLLSIQHFLFHFLQLPVDYHIFHIDFLLLGLAVDLLFAEDSPHHIFGRVLALGFLDLNEPAHEGPVLEDSGVKLQGKLLVGFLVLVEVGQVGI